MVSLVRMLIRKEIKNRNKGVESLLHLCMICCFQSITFTSGNSAMSLPEQTQQNILKVEPEWILLSWIILNCSALKSEYWWVLNCGAPPLLKQKKYISGYYNNPLWFPCCCAFVAAHRRPAFLFVIQVFCGFKNFLPSLITRVLASYHNSFIWKGCQ